VAQVRLTVTRLDLGDLATPGTTLLDVMEPEETLVERAVAWAKVNGYDRLIPSLERTLACDPPPASGYAAVINKPYSLLVFATWPWCPNPHPVQGHPHPGAEDR
jgi:hypothetical protein